MVELRGDTIRLSLDSSTGEFLVDDSATGLRIGPGSPFMQVKGQWDNELDMDLNNETLSTVEITRARNFLKAKFRSKTMPTFDLKFDVSGNFITVSGSIVNDLGAGVHYSSAGQLKSQQVGGLQWEEDENVRVYWPGYQSWTPAGSLPSTTSYLLPPTDFFVKMAFGPMMKKPKDRRHHMIDNFTIIGAGNRYILVGFLTAWKYFPHVEAAFSSKGTRVVELAAKCSGGWMKLEPGQRAELEKMVIGISDDPHELMEKYLNMVGVENKARIPDKVPTGWCSWYRYFTNISRQKIGTNLDSLEKIAGRIPMEYFQLDDGWQERVGEWTWNNKFKNGPRELSLRIKQSGYKPGLWVAPFIAARGSKVYREHKDWFVKDEKGKPVLAGINPVWKGRLYYALDATNEEFLKYLGNLFKAIVNDWGFEYVKLDFMYGALMGTKRADPLATPVEAYRRGLQTIRDAIGDDTLMLGCGAPILPSVGIVDFMRIGADVAPYWEKAYQRAFMRTPMEPSTKNSIRNIITRSAMHGRLWANDPDCLMVRTDHTSLKQDEVQSLVTAIGLSGGAVLLSDDMSVLPDERIDWAATTLPPYEVHAKPVDLFDKAMPEIYYLRGKDHGDRHALALFNWDNNERRKIIDLKRLGIFGPHHAFDFWRKKYLGVVNGDVDTVKIPGHGVALLALVPATENPALLASTLHITAGINEISRLKINDKSLKLEIHLPGSREGDIYLYVPECELQKKVDKVDGRIWMKNKLVKIPVKFQDKYILEI